MEEIAPGRAVRSRDAALALPDLGRYLHGRRDARLLRLGRLCHRPEVLPVVASGALDVAGCEPRHLGAELHRLGHDLARAYAGAGLPALDPGGDPHARAAVICCAAAAPLWQLALRALAELDAAFVVTGCDDLAAWDEAVADPIAAWSCDREGTPEAPSLRGLTVLAIEAHRAALIAQLACDDPEARTALAELWDRALGVATHKRATVAAHLAGVIAPAADRSPGGADLLAIVRAGAALSTLRDALATRRDALVALGRALDDQVDLGPRTEVALALAARAIAARALVGGVAEWMADLVPVPAAQITLARVRAEAQRVGAVAAGIERGFAATFAAVEQLVGMEP